MQQGGTFQLLKILKNGDQVIDTIPTSWLDLSIAADYDREHCRRMEIIVPPILFTALTWGVFSLAVVREKRRESALLFNTPAQHIPLRHALKRRQPSPSLQIMVSLGAGIKTAYLLVNTQLTRDLIFLWGTWGG